MAETIVSATKTLPNSFFSVTNMGLNPTSLLVEHSGLGV